MQFVARRNPGKVGAVCTQRYGRGAYSRFTCRRIERYYAPARIFRSIGMPATFGDMGIDSPDIDRLVEMLHLHKGNPIGGYERLSPADTHAIYTSML